MTIGTKVESQWDKFTGEIKQLYGKVTDQQLEWGLKGQWDKLKAGFKEGYSDSEDAQNDFNSRVDKLRADMEPEDTTDTTDGSCGTSCGCSGKNAA